MASSYNHSALVHTQAHVPAITHYLRDPGSAITHLIGAVCTAIGAYPLLRRACLTGNTVMILSMSVFLVSMFLLYTASTLYHSCTGSEAQIFRLKKLDHSMISVMICFGSKRVSGVCSAGRMGIRSFSTNSLGNIPYSTMPARTNS